LPTDFQGLSFTSPQAIQIAFPTKTGRQKQNARDSKLRRHLFLNWNTQQ
jgi:hypothetical protein